MDMGHGPLDELRNVFCDLIRYMKRNGYNIPKSFIYEWNNAVEHVQNQLNSQAKL